MTRRLRIYNSHILHKSSGTRLAFCFIFKLKITVFTLLSFVLSPCHLYPCCHSLSLVFIRCSTSCHLLYHSLSFVVTLCTSRCHSFSVILTCSHSITTRLSFHRRYFSLLVTLRFFIGQWKLWLDLKVSVPSTSSQEKSLSKLREVKTSSKVRLNENY